MTAQKKQSPDDGAAGLRECSKIGSVHVHYPFSQATRKD